MTPAAAEERTPATPMMEQYARAKAEYPDCLLLFRMGDFYETFFEDAEIASRELGLTLTSRERGDAPRIPLAGVPWHSLDGYLKRLIERGYRVAICEQVEDAALAKGLVKREVVRVVTPGTLLEESGLSAGRNNYLVAAAGDGDRAGMARLDLSTGEFEAEELERGALLAAIENAEARELLLPRDWAEGDLGRALARRRPDIHVTADDAGRFLPESGARAVARHLSRDGRSPLAGLPWAEAAAGAILQYLARTRQGPLHHVATIRRRGESPHLVLDEAALRNLEILEPLRAGQGGATLLGTLDTTATPMGARLLRRWLREPLLDEPSIRARLDAVEELAGDAPRLAAIARALDGLRDLERLAGRLGCERATPRDLGALRSFLARVPGAREALGTPRSGLLAEVGASLAVPGDLAHALETSLGDELPAVITDGGIMRDGASPELDELRRLMGAGRDWVASLQERERGRTGIPSLKVGFNRVFGYYLEVTRPHLALVPPEWERRQTLVNAERFVTRELKEEEERILGAEEKALRLERELFLELRGACARHASALTALAAAVAQLDVLTAFARAARERRWVRPVISDGTRLDIRAGRHPVVESRLAAGEFVPNDVVMDTGKEQILLVTGPNMAGKSTYLRQVAHLVILAQAGSFVPAESAEIGLVDRIFTRVGAGDDLARGASTFLVEMQEVAVILREATHRSLILLDELGRGTSTFDGLSIAWAVTEHLHDEARVRARTLFATHYHELTELSREKPRVVNLNVAVREWGDEIVFLREIRPGASDQSYGIHVARLAGLPADVITRAREVLASLEEGELVREALLPRHDAGPDGGSDPGQPPARQLSLFGGAGAATLAELLALDPESMTPLEALNALARLRARAIREAG